MYEDYTLEIIREIHWNTSFTYCSNCRTKYIVPTTMLSWIDCTNRGYLKKVNGLCKNLII